MKPRSADNTLPAVYNAEPSSELPTIAAGLVHEVKNPLAAIHMHLQLLQGYVEGVENQGLREKLNDKISIIQDEILNLNRTLSSFFTLLQPGSPKEIQSFNLDSLLEQIVRLLEPQAARDDIQIHFKASGLPNLDRWDPSFIRQIVFNLLLNAIQAFKNVSNFSKEKRIYVSARKNKDTIYIEVRDNGPGIPKEVQEKMFDAFYTTRKQKGSGLGLTLVQRMLSVMGARLEVQSQKSKGTAFLVCLEPPSPLIEQKEGKDNPKLLS